MPSVKLKTITRSGWQTPVGSRHKTSDKWVRDQPKSSKHLHS